MENNKRFGKLAEYGRDSFFPAMLRGLMKSRKITQEMVAKKCNVQRQTVSQWMNGNTIPDILSLKSLSEYFGVSCDELVGANRIKENTGFDKDFSEDEDADKTNIIGQRIVELLKKTNRKQNELAKHLNIMRNVISYFCSGRRKPNVLQIVEIAKFFDVTTDYLLGLSCAGTTDINLKEVCDYTGLSVEAIDFIKNNPGIDIELLQRFMSVQQQFGEMLEILNYKK